MVSYRQELHVEGGQARPSHGQGRYGVVPPRVARGRRPSSSITWLRSLWCRTAKSYTWKAAKLVPHMAKVAMVSYRQELHVEGGQARPSHG